MGGVECDMTVSPVRRRIGDLGIDGYFSDVALDATVLHATLNKARGLPKKRMFAALTLDVSRVACIFQAESVRDF